MNGRTVKFHRLFDIPTSEVLIRTFPCALKAEILLQGTFYVSANFFCFYARLANKRKTIKIPTRTICEITREKTAIFFPNAIGIRTAEVRYVFGSILSRENTLKLLLELWKAAACQVEDCVVVPPVVAAIQESRKILRSSSDSDLATLQNGGPVLLKHRGHMHLNNGDCVQSLAAAAATVRVASGQQLASTQTDTIIHHQPLVALEPNQQLAMQPDVDLSIRSKLTRQGYAFLLQLFLLIKSQLAFIMEDSRMAVGCSLIVLCLAYVLYLAYQIHLIQQNISERLEELLQSSSLLR